MRELGSIGWLVLVLLLALATLGCSPAEDDSMRTAADATTASSAPTADEGERSEGHRAAFITSANVLEHERAWPDIVALVEPWTPPGTEQVLKPGYRGALIRVEADGRARIAFGRHGNQLIPLDHTDLIERANEVAAGGRHKIAPNFLAHFGTQLLHPDLEGIAPYPTPELAKSTRFLCIFANPARPDFPALVERLRSLGEVAGLQVLFFPLAMPEGSAERVKETLTTFAWRVPFAYPQAAEVHAQKLVGKIPEAPEALLITDEGRSLLELPLEQGDAVDRLRAAAVEAAAGR